jgi:creatinine amidohydrolase
MEQVEYRCLLPHQFAARFERMPLAYLPVGSLEWHGEHLALGNDGLKIEAICKRAALRGGGIVLPCIYLGVTGMVRWGRRYRLGNRGVFAVEPWLLRHVLEAQLRNLDVMGFQGAMVITGHDPQEQVMLVKQAAAEFRPARGLRALGASDLDLGDEVDHAAKWETSILMALRPELVDMSRLPANLKQKLEGVGGADPRTTASAAVGRKAVEGMVKRLCALGRKLVKRGSGSSRRPARSSGKRR